MQAERFHSNDPFLLESGRSLPGIDIAYHTCGTLNGKADNVAWICHALTANSDAADWWSGIVGKGKAFDPEKYFIVCANIIGSCYGSSGPHSLDPSNGQKYYGSFPLITIRDMVNAHILLRKHLGIKKIAVAAGGSMGAYQALEWSLMEPGVIEKMVLTTTCAKETAWGIAIHTAQRLAIEADPTWKDKTDNAGAKGLKAARAIGMLTYRNYTAFQKTQTDEDQNKTDNFKATSYISYQGDKLVKRFNAQSYWLLTKAMDSHNLSRGRGKMEEVLSSIKTPAIVVGISSDLLCPLPEQRYLATHLGKASFEAIESPYGHDGFLVESEKLNELLIKFL